MRVAVTLEQCWHRVPGGTATSAIRSVKALVALDRDTIVGVAARHSRAPLPAFRPSVPVRQFAVPRPVLYRAWHHLRRPTVEALVGPVDVIHATGMAVPPPSAPLVVTVHDLAFLDQPEHATKRGRTFFAQAVELAQSDADQVVCPSSFTRDACVRFGFDPGRLHVVPWGVDPHVATDSMVAAVRLRYGLPDRFLLWVGTIEPRKNLRVLLEAIALADVSLPLVVVGPQGWNEDLGAQVARLGDSVRVLGFVPPTDLQALYRAADVFCYPSVAEGFGLPVLEAMAQGTPVVTSAGSAMAEFAQGAGELVDPGSAREIATAIERLVDDDREREVRSIAAVAAAKAMPWTKVATSLSDVFDIAAGRSPAASPPTARGYRSTIRTPGNPLRVGMNLLWLVPGVVGGSEDYTVRLLEAVGRHQSTGVDLRLFVNRGFAAAHPGVSAAFPVTVAPIWGASKPTRILAENVWLPLTALRHRVELMHHAGGLVPPLRIGPVVETVHDFQPLAMPENFSWAKRWYLRRWAPWSARTAERVITITEWVADDVSARSGAPRGQFRQVPHGNVVVNAASEAQQSTVRGRYGLDADPFFLFPAITYVHKNHRMLIDAMAAADRLLPGRSFRLVLAGGEASEEANVRAAIAASPVRSRIVRTGRIPSVDLDVLYDAATAVLFPSRYEGCGIPVLEAFAHRTPVVASDVGAMPETAGRAALLLHADDVSSWAAAMVSLLEDQGLREEFIAAASRHLELRPSWDDAASALLATYHEVLGE